jgi:rare lipoprotein A
MKYLSVLIIAVYFPCIAIAQQYEEVGECSYYADRVHGRYTASGERYDKYLLTAAHKTLPFNTLVRVTNARNNKTTVVRIIDRGPYSGKRILDISKAAARELDFVSDGLAWVTIEAIGMANADSVKAALEQRRKDQTEKHLHRPQGKKPVHKSKTVRATEEGLAPKSFYDQDLVSCKPMGYGVQVGYYKSFSGCHSDMHIYQAKYKAVAYIYVESKKNVKYYKLVMGQFAGRESAASLRDEMIRDNPSCFIVAYKDL